MKEYNKAKYYVELTKYIDDKPAGEESFFISRTTHDEVFRFVEEHIKKLTKDQPHVRYARVFRQE